MHCFYLEYVWKSIKNHLFDSITVVLTSFVLLLFFTIHIYVMTGKEITVHYYEFNHVRELSSEYQSLLEEASKACADAYAPYSGFKVGAAIRCSNGTVIIGNNQENAAYPSGLCAERVALFSAMAINPQVIIEQIAITVKTKSGNSKEPVSPCGACRQVIAEYEHRQGKEIEILFSSESGRIILVKGISNLLPFTFNSDNLTTHEKDNLS